MFTVYVRSKTDAERQFLRMVFIIFSADSVQLITVIVNHAESTFAMMDVVEL